MALGSDPEWFEGYKCEQVFWVHSSDLAGFVVVDVESAGHRTAARLHGDDSHAYEFHPRSELVGIAPEARFETPHELAKNVPTVLRRWSA